MLAGSYPDRTVQYLLDVLLIGWKIHLSYFLKIFSQGHFLRFGKARRVSKHPSFLRSQSGRVYWKLLRRLVIYTTCFCVVLPKWTEACWQSAYCPGMGILPCSPAHAVPPSWLSNQSRCQRMQKARPHSLESRPGDIFACVCVLFGEGLLVIGE